MHDNMENPFDPKWYKTAFDKFDSIADQASKENDLIDQGYQMPDADGSKSSVIRNEAVTNNSFNEEILKKSLEDIYLNNSNHLIASNHDNTGFFQWTGHMSDMSYISNTDLCEISIPWGNIFISSTERDQYKISQFYRQWIKVEDILNNWNIFKWHIFLFIDKKIYSEYEIRMDDQEVSIRFKYNKYWVDHNHSIFIYKVNTNAQCRMLVSRELCFNRWAYKMPVDALTDKRVSNSSNVIVAFNKISDTNIRIGNNNRVDVIGDNLEFFPIKDGYIDMTSMSDFNKNYIESEPKNWIWMSIIAPKFFHEYPIMLPTDYVYRPYKPDLYPIMTTEYQNYKHVKTNISDTERRQIFIDKSGEIFNEYDGWEKLIRPIVLSDAFEPTIVDPYSVTLEDVHKLGKLTTDAADIIENFRFFVQDRTVTSDRVNKYLDDTFRIFTDLYNGYKEFLARRQIDEISKYDKLYNDTFIPAIKECREHGEDSDWFHPITDYDKNFWTMVSPLITVPRELVDRYKTVEIINSMARKNVWEDVNAYSGKVRFQRPIEEQDFWTFEYDLVDRVWRPCPLEITRHFPDVYIAKDNNDPGVSLDRVFKAFFFYSDTMNILNESRDTKNATPDWSNDTLDYYHEADAVYRDIFMEKFYWMGIRSIYKGLLVTNYRWEIVEYILDNISYKRFNELFIKTMDPYFKLGLATYMNGSNFGFPFDEAVDKLKESMTIDHNGYNKVSNFEVYLNNQWVPSYFDHVIKIMDDWDCGDRLIRRPPNSFDMRRLQPAIIQVQNDIITVSKEVFNKLEWIIAQLKDESYNLKIENMVNFDSAIKTLLTNMEATLDYITNLDLNLTSIDDINHIISELKKYAVSVNEINSIISIVTDDTTKNDIYNQKRKIVNDVEDALNKLPEFMDKVLASTNSFDMNGFMKAINDLNSYFDAAKTNPNDCSLIGEVNEFHDAWTEDVKATRNKLFVSTATLYGTFDPDKTYTNEEVTKFVELVNTVKDDIDSFRKSVTTFWKIKGLDVDQIIIDRLDHVQYLIAGFNVSMTAYYDSRNDLVLNVNKVLDILKLFDIYKLSKKEYAYEDGIKFNLAKIIENLSYIVGVNRKETAYIALTACHSSVSTWLTFISKEESVFTTIYSIIKQPNEFSTVITDNVEIIDAIILYMDTVNLPFVPDTSLPTYSDIYEVDEFKIDYTGFKYDKDDIVYSQKLGVYKVDSVRDKLSRVDGIELTNFRKTVFRDPMAQSRSYDTISEGHGIGLTIKALSSKQTRIINDEAAKGTVIKIRNILNNVSGFIETPNPYNNIEFTETLDSITGIKTDWDNLNTIFSKYMTPDIINKVNSTINSLLDIIPVSKAFMENRSKINPAAFSASMENIIRTIYKYVTGTNQQNDEFFYYDNAIRTSQDKLSTFIDTNTSWTDTDELLRILSECKGVIKTYNNRVIDNLTESDDLKDIRSDIEKLFTSITDINTAVSKELEFATPVQSVIDNVNLDLSVIPNDYHHDEWYKIDKILPALVGKDYQRGDIVEIVPRLHTGRMEKLNEDKEHVILNDKIFLQVMEVDNGSVVKVQALMDYALPYLMWGIRETITHTGNGTGLTVDVFSSEVTLSGSTLLRDKNTYIPIQAPYNESDLMAFKFENIHDLNVSYDIFLGGKQITNFFQTHESAVNPLHPNKNDVIYINANDIMNLKNVAIHIPAEHYFIYKINNVTVKDPGAGYCVGQDIFLDTDQLALQLKIMSLIYGPYKGINTVTFKGSNFVKGLVNPSTKNAVVADDTMNNIDDEFHVSHYDLLPEDGNKKPATMSYSQDLYEFVSKRLDNLKSDNRNEMFTYPEINMVKADPAVDNGDYENHWYLGTRIDNSQCPVVDKRRWEGILALNPPTDSFIPDKLRIPPNNIPKGEYQMFDRLKIHRSKYLKFTVDKTELPSSGDSINLNIEFGVDSSDNKFYQEDMILSNAGGSVNALLEFSVISNNIVYGDLEVETYADLPKHTHDWPQAEIGKTVIVKCDETQHKHRTIYTLRTFIANGFFVFDEPEFADMEWNSIHVDWMNTDWYPDRPTLKAQYPDAPWRTAKTYRLIQEEITDKKFVRFNNPRKLNPSTYIHKITMDDLSVFNWTTKEWENLHDNTRWKLEIQDDPEKQDWGFTLTFLQDGLYQYDMKLFLNKIPENQLRNADLKRNAVMDINAVIAGEVNTPAIDLSVNTGRNLRMRKLLPYDQKESFVIGVTQDGDKLGYEMNFKLAPYMHYKNEIHLEDIKLFNKTANRFENILDPSMFEVRFKDPKAVTRGFETNTMIVSSIISNAGSGFIDGYVWGWNEELGVHVFGEITTDVLGDGHLLTFKPTHCPNPPKNDISLEFYLYQDDKQTDLETSVVLIEFKTERKEMFGDGYIHNVTNPLAPVPKEIKIIAQFNLDSAYEYDVIIGKSKLDTVFIDKDWQTNPVIRVNKRSIPQNMLYVLTENGRFPLINPSTGKPTLSVKESEFGTDITFMNLYRRYEHLRIMSAPYPMRSVYTKRRIPKHGYIDLAGKINKPLNRKYFEFWVNGKLLTDEVTIISPTKMFLHGLHSLRNLEIIEINRDNNEYFSDIFLRKKDNDERPFKFWDFETYLDAALEGNLENDNYTLEEQEYLLTPVWKQVAADHPSFKDYPPNVNTEPDILQRVLINDMPNIGTGESSYEYVVVDPPTLEGIPLAGRKMSIEQFGFRPISNEEIIKMMNEEWSEEIKNNPYFPEHIIISDEEWYGICSRLYDENGTLVDNINNAAYRINDKNLLKINSKTKISKIIKNNINYDLE